VAPPRGLRSTYVTVATPKAPVEVHDSPCQVLPLAHGSAGEPQKECEVHLVDPWVLVYRSTRACFTVGQTLPDARPPLLSLGQESHTSFAVLLHCLQVLSRLRKEPAGHTLELLGVLRGGPGTQPWWVRTLTAPTWNAAVQRWPLRHLDP
jgi:hypothetical protein